MHAAAARPLSGLQKEVLSLLRSVVRAARAKPPASRAAAMLQLRAEFEQHSRLPRGDVPRVEWLLRRGRGKLELLRGASALSLWTPSPPP